ncbi:DUF4147 domain protein [Natrialba magadii ATCC 43099]|uniref:DUF4147 domain protein n=1 Tax=Natrialba magadii (strain ATCC 43099 / DSM 3394 / CCM 3739 / CIP 104546 / IAM 13178 / JCM 8861 / NBRC 102185 / NCIMB 2190 / MS3) TaxID=547559 RepID=D3T032_NATMM|nr:DUF4147 domain-containing protein [Natrialba magadii]ADD04390.1 DUF4147 domain protein [Natrialba magadii ATCC 43099]ELY25786.1 hydroxypyruvate reductase [Natrialba magadii ATCC 43099]
MDGDSPEHPSAMADRDGPVAYTPTAAHEVALECLLAGIEAARPENRIADTCTVSDDALTVADVTGDGGNTASYDLTQYDRITVLGGGNAAAHVVRALEAEFEFGGSDRLGEQLDTGVVVTDDPVETDIAAVYEGSHPIPSERGVRNTTRILDAAEAAGPDELVLVVVTGGASALLTAPATSLSLADLRAVTRALLASGATIDEINAVRKHCSAIKGGQLARAAAPATVVTLALSDVVGDDPSVIASGPTVPDATTYGDALAVLERYGIDAPDAVVARLEGGHAGDRPETPTADADAELFDRTSTHIIGNGRVALEAARDAADEQGYTPLVLSSRVRGEARESARTHVAIAEECRQTGEPCSPPAVLLSGGETTVTLCDDPGRGGPNQEFALASALELESDGIVVGSVDTDGVDGATDVAGALVDATSVETALESEGTPDQSGTGARVDARDALARNDAFAALEDADALVRTGPTGTNVNDLRVIVVESATCTDRAC